MLPPARAWPTGSGVVFHLDYSTATLIDASQRGADGEVLLFPSPSRIPSFRSSAPFTGDLDAAARGDGDHLIFRWQNDDTEYAVSLQAWKPVVEASATLRSVVESISAGGIDHSATVLRSLKRWVPQRSTIATWSTRVWTRRASRTPGRFVSTLADAAATPRRSAVRRSWPRSSEPIRPPTSESPAPMGFRTVTGGASTHQRSEPRATARP